MSIQAKSGKIGIPIVLLHESEALLITVEMKTGDVARGWLMKAEDCWNVKLKDVTLTNSEGNERRLKTLYIRGDRINFIANALMRCNHYLEFQYNFYQIHLVLVNYLLIVFLAIWKLVLMCLVY